ncbi:MAG: DUF3422 family protein [Alphaproteobacteria bacterium]|nr:DUF3422 family protein [Alphaproteobacteria bacterium]
MIGPAVVRHLVIRLRTADNPRFKPTHGERRAAWVTFRSVLSAFINNARRNVGQSDDVQIVKDNPVAGTNQHSIDSTVLVDLTPSALAQNAPKCRIRMRVDVHFEYYSITVFADQFDANDPNAIIGGLTALATDVGATPETVSNHLTALHDTIWQQARQPFRYLLEGVEALPGDHVADLRGVVLIAPRPDARRTPAASRPGAMTPAVQAFWDTHQTLVSTFLGSSPPTGSVPGVVGAESVACTFGDGQVLYMAPLVAGSKEPRPVKYLLVADPVMPPEQVGRLMRRMNVLFELRHLALLDYDCRPGEKDLKTASRELRRIGDDLDKQIKAAEVAKRQDNATGADRRLWADDERNQNTKIAGLLELNGRLTKLNDFADGGINFRVEQSRLYGDEFKSRIEDLRVGRIEGYPPYDAFARRRVIHLFARIEQIGRRIAMFGRRIDRWAFLIDADSSTKFHEDIRNLQQTTKNLSENGEKFASIFFVYYAGAIVKEYVIGTHDPALKSTFVAIWLAVLALAVIDAAAYNGAIARNVYRLIGFLGACVWAVLLRFGRFPGREALLHLIEGWFGWWFKFLRWHREDWLPKRDRSGKNPKSEEQVQGAAAGSRRDPAPARTRDESRGG